jgi:hypothetical protein
LPQVIAILDPEADWAACDGLACPSRGCISACVLPSYSMRDMDPDGGFVWVGR